MPSRLAIAQKAVNGTLERPVKYVWISDNLLHESLSSLIATFSPQCKRHGSNVPGPLEARKRSSGRRLNNSASRRDIAPVAAPFDLTSLWTDWGEFEGFGKWRKRTRETFEWQPPSQAVAPFHGNDSGRGLGFHSDTAWSCN